LGDIKEDLDEVNRAVVAVQQAVATEAAAERDLDKKLKDAAAAGQAIDPKSPQAQQQLAAAEAADQLALTAWEALQAAKRATAKAMQTAGKALSDLYNDVFIIGPL
jgi:hypothetical protein